MNGYEQVELALADERRRWLVTGVAGFIGSNLLLALLRAGQEVVGVDNLLTGHRSNLEEVRDAVGAAWSNFSWLEGDIGDRELVRRACDGADVVLHQAALGSVPRSIARPDLTNANNVSGFLNVLTEAKDAGVGRFVYASSSSVYGDHPGLPKVEDRVGECLSPYAVSKKVNEMYAAVFGRCYGVGCIGLRYFNVFGPRQSPDGPYAAVIPKWIDAMLRGEEVVINGDGETSRDFCYIDNVVQANLRAGLVDDPEALGEVYNIAAGGRTTLNELYEMLRVRLTGERPGLAAAQPVYRDFRPGDIRHSNADISKATRLLGYRPTHDLGSGLDASLGWYLSSLTTA